MVSSRRSAALFLTAIVVFALLLLPALMPAPAHATADGHGFTRGCGDHIDGNGAGWYDVQAYHASCRVARRVARRFWNANDRDFNGWHCFDRQIGDEVWVANCVRTRDRHQHVRFEFGA